MSNNFLVSYGDVLEKGNHEKFMEILQLPMNVSLSIKDTFELTSKEYNQVFNSDSEEINY